MRTTWQKSFGKRLIEKIFWLSFDSYEFPFWLNRLYTSLYYKHTTCGHGALEIGKIRHSIFVYIITTIVFCSKASLGTLCSQKPQIICWLWLGKSYFLLVFKALCKCMADNLWIFPPGFAEEVPFLQANISWWSKRMQPQLLKCVYLPTLLLINIII